MPSPGQHILSQDCLVGYTILVNGQVCEVLSVNFNDITVRYKYRGRARVQKILYGVIVNFLDLTPPGPNYRQYTSPFASNYPYNPNTKTNTVQDTMTRRKPSLKIAKYHFIFDFGGFHREAVDELKRRISYADRDYDSSTKTWNIKRTPENIKVCVDICVAYLGGQPELEIREDLKNKQNEVIYGHKVDFSSHYSVLGIAETATQDEIKKAYRKASMQHHPDKNNGTTTDLFIHIQKAYQTLSDPKKRKRYDVGLKMSKNGTSAKTRFDDLPF